MVGRVKFVVGFKIKKIFFISEGSVTTVKISKVVKGSIFIF